MKNGSNNSEAKEIKRGLIIKGVGGFYTVLGDDGSSCVCKARGLFRRQEITPVPGDRVEYSEGASGEKSGRFEAGGYLLAILPRKNELIRPAVANIDKLFIVIAATRPAPDLLLADKLLILAEKYGIEPLIIINKCDEAAEGEKERWLAQYAPTGCKVFTVSALTGEGLEALRAEMKRTVICLAGQSAVGKSSLLNALIPGMELKVGALSEKTERGKHTTRHTELIPLGDGAAVLDTPGFSLLDTLELEPEEIRLLYPELRGAEENCRFQGCLHVSEPGCYVKEHLIMKDGAPLADGEEKRIHKERYDRYVRLVNEAVEHRRHRYD